MKETYIHGTSFECAQKIEKEGFSNHRETTWLPSVSSEIYLKKMNTEDCEHLRDDISFVIEAATTTSAKFASTSQKIALFIFEIDDDEAELELDYSCPNMDKLDCYAIAVDKLNKLNYKLIFIDGYLPWMRFHYLPISNENFYLDYKSMTEFEEIAIEQILRDKDNYYNGYFQELIWNLKEESMRQFLEACPELDVFAN